MAEAGYRQVAKRPNPTKELKLRRNLQGTSKGTCQDGFVVQVYPDLDVMSSSSTVEYTFSANRSDGQVLMHLPKR